MKNIFQSKLPLLLFVLGLSPGLAGSLAEVRGNLSVARDEIWALRDATAEVAGLDPRRDSDRANRITTRFGRGVHSARQRLEQARSALAEGRRTGDLAGATADQLRLQLDQYERDLTQAQQRYQDNLKFEWPPPPSPTPPPPEATTPRPSPATTAGPSTTPATLAELRIFRDRVDAAFRKARATYDFAGATRTLDAAFVSGGVDWARRYSRSWGGWTYSEVWPTVARHRDWLRVLASALARNPDQPPIEPAYLRLLQTERARWRRETRDVEALCSRLIELRVERGRKLDEAREHRLRERATRRRGPDASARALEASETANAAADAAQAALVLVVARLGSGALLTAPVSYEDWRRSQPSPDSPESLPEPVSEAAKFKQESVQMYLELEQRLRGLGSSPVDWPEYLAVAADFDSAYKGNQIWDFYDFNGRRMIGGEVNYYYQGMLWARLGVPKFAMYRIIDVWNHRHGRLSGNPNQYAAAAAGWNDTGTALAHPQGAEAYFRSDRYVPPDIRYVGENPDRRIPGYEDE